MAALQGFMLTFQMAAFAVVLAVTLGVTPPQLGRSEAAPAPAPAVSAGDTDALV